MIHDSDIKMNLSMKIANQALLVFLAIAPPRPGPGRVCARVRQGHGRRGLHGHELARPH